MAVNIPFCVMPSNRDRLNIDIEGLRGIIQRLAEEERRSLSQMVRILIEEALISRSRYTRPMSSASPAPSIAELIKTWNLEELAKEARVPIEDVQSLANGARPNDEQLVALGRVFDYDTEQLLQIRMRDFPRTGNGKEKING
jgi:hypothetical protein